MGAFRTTISIENLERRGESLSVSDVVVDTGSEFSWVPRQVLEALDIHPEFVQAFVVADGRRLERSVGMALLRVSGRIAPDFVVFAESGDMILLGARSLEGLNLRVDPQRKELVPAGPILAVSVT